MSFAYWSQWDKEELDSWQGKDFEYDDSDDYVPDYEIYEIEEDSCSCGYHCMDCLGFSWRDFK